MTFPSEIYAGLAIAVARRLDDDTAVRHTHVVGFLLDAPHLDDRIDALVTSLAFEYRDSLRLDDATC